MIMNSPDYISVKETGEGSGHSATGAFKPGKVLEYADGEICLKKKEVGVINKMIMPAA